MNRVGVCSGAMICLYTEAVPGALVWLCADLVSCAVACSYTESVPGVLSWLHTDLDSCTMPQALFNTGFVLGALYMVMLICPGGYIIGPYFRQVLQ